MKQLFMCVNYPIENPAIGIAKKIKMQIDAFRKLGYEVTYTAYTGSGVSIIKGNTTLASYTFSPLLPTRLQKVFRNALLMRACISFLEKEKSHYKLGFVRWNALTNNFVKAAKMMNRNCEKVIMDCHGYHPAYNPKTLKGKYIQFFTQLNAHKMKEYIDLCLLEAKDTTVWGITAMPIDTGIDVDKYTPHTYTAHPKELRMVSVANELPYHGYDRIIRGIANYDGDRIIHLHLVGKMSKKTMNLVEKLQVADKVTFHGYKTGDELRLIYEDSNMGVGPLAPHRIGGKQGTGIKTKEYFAIGIPYFYAGQELLVPDDFPFVLKCQSNEQPIDLYDIFAFLDRIAGAQKTQDIMREFAREHFSWINIFSNAEKIL